MVKYIEASSQTLIQSFKAKPLKVRGVTDLEAKPTTRQPHSATSTDLKLIKKLKQQLLTPRSAKRRAFEIRPQNWPFWGPPGRALLKQGGSKCQI